MAGSLAGEGQGLWLNNKEPSHGDLREEPSLTGWVRCLLPAHVLVRARGDLGEQGSRVSLGWSGMWVGGGESLAHLPLMDWEREMSQT